MANHILPAITCSSIRKPEEPARMWHEYPADLTQPQLDKVAIVELRVRFIGEMRRQN